MRLRDIRREDYAGVNALWESVWWPTRSRAGWDWLAQNPAALATKAPLGWVIEEDDGALAAVLGALPTRFWRGEDSVYGLSGHSLVVRPNRRGASRHLIERIIAQPGFAFCYTLNANALSHRLYGRFGFVTPPGAVADRKLSWMLDPLACLTARGLRSALESRPGLARRLGELLQPGRRFWRASSLRLPERIVEIRPDALTDTLAAALYADFWSRLRGERDWLADRSPQTFGWRCADPDLTTAPLALAYVRDGEMLAFASAMFAKENPIEPLVLEVIDLQALACAPQAIGRLMDALLAAARQRGAAKLRLSMYGPDLFDRLGRHATTARVEGGWPHAHVRALGATPQGWSPTPFDGDLFMSLRPPPLALRQSA
ncbi:MAG TPA: N-acetyltransferase [Asticcacaulis sp.]|nr:N-acetyltransferase [Asticcacaulis sp.]